MGTHLENKSTVTQKTYLRLVDMYNGFRIFDNYKSASITKSDLFWRLYNEVTSINMDMLPEHEQDYLSNLITQQFTAIFNNQNKKYTVTEVTFKRPKR